MVHPPWLDDDEQRTWRAFLAANRMVTERVERALQAESGMPQAYYEILVRLSEAPGRTLRMNVLASSSLSSRSRLSHAVARMEEAGWIRRTTCRTDRRGQLAELTDDGLDVLRRAAPGHVAAVRATVFDALTREQQHALRDAAETLATHLSGDRSWPVDADGPDCATVSEDCATVSEDCATASEDTA